MWTAGCGLKKKIKQKKSVWCYLRVHRFVLFQADCVSEGFAAHFARKRPGATVRSADVDLQPVRSGKHLVERREMSCGRFWEKKTKKQDLLKKKKNWIVYWFHFGNLFKIRRSEVNYRAIQSLVKGHFRSVCYLKVTLKAGNIYVFLYEWPSPEVQILC